MLLERSTLEVPVSTHTGKDTCSKTTQNTELYTGVIAGDLA
jgi:hypothetical protein